MRSCLKYSLGKWKIPAFSFGTISIQFEFGIEIEFNSINKKYKIYLLKIEIMEITNLQKDIIDSIIKNETYDAFTFIYNFLKYTSPEETIKILEVKDEKRFSGMEGNLIILHDFETSFNALKEYIALVEKLKKEFLVIEFLKDDYEYQSYNAKFLKFPTMLIQKQEKIEQPVETHTLAYQYGVNYIIPSPDLEDFKNRGYKTLEEKRFELEVKDRKTAMNWTKAIALSNG